MLNKIKKYWLKNSRSGQNMLEYILVFVGVVVVLIVVLGPAGIFTQRISGSIDEAVRGTRCMALEVCYDPAGCPTTCEAECDAPGGGTILHGGSRTYYRDTTVQFGSTCVSEVRSCWGGTLSGSFTNTGCHVLPLASCVGPDGAIIANGSINGRTYYLAASVPCGDTCSSEVRMCTNGSLSGSYTEPSCSVDVC